MTSVWAGEDPKSPARASAAVVRPPEAEDEVGVGIHQLFRFLRGQVGLRGSHFLSERAFTTNTSRGREIFHSAGEKQENPAGQSGLRGLKLYYANYTGA